MAEKSDAEHPAWLKRMQNGTIGEARSRAFLIDRFWILERSVDIDGADLIIQRRLTAYNLLDRDAPRLGVIQVKFYGTDSTSQYVHKEYVLDSNGNPRSEFFLLCHSGEEEGQRLFLLTAAEIQKNFSISKHNGSEKFYLPHDKVVDGSKHEIKNKKLALDRIENHLKLADFSANRRFMSWILPSAETSLDGILPDYKEPLDNYWGSIPQGFRDLKSTARDALMDVEEVHHLLVKVADATDPLEAEKDISRIAYHCKSGRGWSIDLPDGLGNEDFFSTCKKHRDLVDTLRNDGLLDAFILLRTELKRQIGDYLEPHFPVDGNLVHVFDVFYSPEDFSLIRIESQLIDAAEFVGPGAQMNSYGRVEIPSSWPDPDVRQLNLGHVQAYWTPGRYGYTIGSEDKSLDRFKGYDFSIYLDCVAFIYELKYGDKAAK